MSKIIRFKAENYKKIEVIEIYPKDLDDFVILTGKNKVGKSSAIDAIWSVLSNSQLSVVKPIREGTPEGAESYSELELEDIILKRIWTSNERSYLHATTKDGARYPSPQSLINNLRGKVSALDPMEFNFLSKTSEGRKEQVKILLDLAELSEDPRKLDEEYAEKYRERTQYNQEVSRCKAILKDLPEPKKNLPDSETSISSLLDKRQKLQFENNDRDTKSSQLLEYKRNGEAIKKEMEDIQDEIAKLKQRIEDLTEDHIKLDDELNKLRTRYNETATEISSMPFHDLSLIDQQIASAEDLNKDIRLRNNYAKIENEMGENYEISQRLTSEMEEIQKKKLEILSKAKFPIDGLGYDEYGVTYNKLPLTQASETEQFKVAVALAIAANSEFKVITSKYGSIFDDEHIEIIRKMIKDTDYQAWIEKVDEKELPSVVIEEGKVLKIRNKTKSKMKKGKITIDPE